MFDPLTNGRTVGEIVGPVTFIPGVGVRLDTYFSHIRYRLPRPLVNGEFSMVITNVATNTEGGKTKLFAMSEGLSDLITNNRRFTVEKRGDPEGIVAWRMITHNDQIDTEGAEREFVSFNPNLPYLWTAIWNGSLTVRAQEGGPAGRRFTRRRRVTRAPTIPIRTTPSSAHRSAAADLMPPRCRA